MRTVKVIQADNPEPLEVDLSDIESVGWVRKPGKYYMTLSKKDNTQVVCEYSKEVAMELFGLEDLP